MVPYTPIIVANVVIISSSANFFHKNVYETGLYSGFSTTVSLFPASIIAFAAFWTFSFVTKLLIFSSVTFKSYP